MSGSGEDRDARLQRSIADLFDHDGEDDDTFGLATEDDDVEEEETTDADDYTDAHEELQDGDIEIIFEDDDDDAEEEGEGETEPATTAAAATPATAQAEIDAINQRRQRTLAHLQQLLGGHNGLQRILASNNYRIVTLGANHAGEDDDEDDDDDDDWSPYRRRHRRRRPTNRDPKRFPPIPSEAGRNLMDSGVFGIRDSKIEKLCQRKRSVSERLLWRRLGVDARPTARRHNRLIAQQLIPNTTHADQIIHYDSRAYSGQFSDDGNFFFSCTQNFKVQMYDTSNPYDWKYYKTVDFPFGQWTITDATLSPDNRFLAYSSIRHTICLAPTDPNDPNDHTLLDFTNYTPTAILGDPHHAHYMGRQGFGIWSLRFSGDGREIVAGTGDHSVLVYDLETRKTTLKLRKHTDDVNAVCFGDKSSPHILFSGSDDQTLRVWDRRSMADGREAGVFVGHTEGITYIDSKGDGRYVLSNGKDQMMKMWDLRKMVAPSKFDRMNLQHYTTNFDYRFAPYDDSDYIPNPDDCSVVTFRGHKVLKTLIRCHFSPPTSTNSRYVYSGSEDGKIYIWNLDGTLKACIDVGNATKDTRERGRGGEGYGYDWDMGNNSHVWKTCVRDASWSPNAPMIAATSWNGWGMSTGTVSVHSWNDSTEVPLDTTYSPSSPSYEPPGHPSYFDVDDGGEPEMGVSYNARLQQREGFKSSRVGQSRAWGRQQGRGLRSNPVRPVRFGAEDETLEAGW